MTTSTTSMTAEEFLRGDERHHSQLIDGEVVANEPNVRHQRISFFLGRRLQDWAESAPGFGEAFIPINVRLDMRQVYGPDASWIADPSRLEAWGSDGPVDLAVEVRSPSTWHFDIGTKKRFYEERGLPELWLVDTEADVVLVFRRSAPEVAVFDVELELADGEELTSPMLPGFALPVAGVFAR
jgi:Uma2 family endonuclease